MVTEDVGIELSFEGSGLDEIARLSAVDSSKVNIVKPGDVMMRVDSRYFRPAEANSLLGALSLAAEKLGWTPQIKAREMCTEMIAADLNEARRTAFLLSLGTQRLCCMINSLDNRDKKDVGANNNPRVFVMWLIKSSWESAIDCRCSHVNIGTGTECTIRKLAETIDKTVGYEGRIIWALINRMGHHENYSMYPE